MNDYFEKEFCNMIVAKEAGSVYRNPTLAADIKNYPRYLYKYKAGHKEHDFQMVEDSYLWADFPVSFDDPTDSFVNFNFTSEDETNLMSSFLDNYNNIVSRVTSLSNAPLKKSPQVSDDDIEKYKRAVITPSGKFSEIKMQKYIQDIIKKADPAEAEQMQQAYNHFVSGCEAIMKNKIEPILENMVQFFRQKSKLCCLTKRKDNQKVWEDFADKYQGFAIEYDIEKCIGHADAEVAISNMFQVLYFKKVPSVSLCSTIEASLYKNNDQPQGFYLPLLKQLYQQMLLKKKEYSGEEEWRIISNDNKIDFPAISAVYMGCKIPIESENRLKEICFRKNIPLYKQRFRRFSNQMDFQLVE